MTTSSLDQDTKKKKFRISASVMNMAPRVSILLLLGLVLAILSPYFLKVNNLINVLSMASIPIILAIGQTLVVLTGNIDLSLGAVFSIGGVVPAALMKFLNVPVPIAVLAGVIAGGLMGMANGVLISKVKLPSFIATYGLKVAVTGIAVAILQGYVVYGFPDAFRFLGIDRVLNIPVPIYVATIVFVLIWFLLRRSTFGRKLYATGANMEAARLSGIKVDWVIIWAFVLAGMLAALAGIIQVSRVNSSHAFLGDTMLLPAIAAVVLGGTSMFGGIGGVFGTVIGALIMSVIDNGLNLVGAPSILQQFIVGVIILLAIVIDQTVRKVTEKQLQ
jgi:ribose/xylose/arabinose/galactoside ABC-type transport system permease subunit